MSGTREGQDIPMLPTALLPMSLSMTKRSMLVSGLMPSHNEKTANVYLSINRASRRVFELTSIRNKCSDSRFVDVLLSFGNLVSETTSILQ